jgi:hypothetical protein
MRKIPNLRWIDRTGREDADVAAEIATRIADCGVDLAIGGSTPQSAR